MVGNQYLVSSRLSRCGRSGGDALVTLHTSDKYRLTTVFMSIHDRIVSEMPMVRPGLFAGTHLHAAGPSPPVGVQRDRVPPGAQKEEQLTRV